MIRSSRVVAVWLIVAGFALAAVPQAGTAAPTDASPLFARVWQRTDGLVASGQADRPWVWGPGPFKTTTEPYGGVARQVQYYDKGRLEVADLKATTLSPDAVTNGRLVWELVAGLVEIGPDVAQQGAPAQLPVAGDPVANPNAPTYASFRFVASLANDRQVKPRLGEAVIETIAHDGHLGQNPHLGGRATVAAYSQETGHNIPDVFVTYLASQGPVTDGHTVTDQTVIDAPLTTGYPITEAYWTQVVADGRLQDVLVQLFERRTLLYWPAREAGRQVEFGDVGQHYYLWRYFVGAAPGQAVTYRNVTLTVTSVNHVTDEPGPESSANQKLPTPLSTGGVFVIVEVKVSNPGTTAVSFDLDQFIMTDSQGRQYEISKDATALAAARLRQATGQRTIRPGFTMAMVGVWEVAADARGLLLTPGFGQKPALAVD